MDVEYTVTHITSPINESLTAYNFSIDPVFSSWHSSVFAVEPDLLTALNVYNETFVYELIKGGYTREETELVNLIRIRAYDFIRRGEDEIRYSKGMPTSKVALADRLYNYKKLKADPVL